MSTFIEPYNPKWQLEFDEIQKVLQSALSDLKVDIQHVGSTSVPGLFAKPILDIDIIIEDKGLLPKITAQLERVGYESKGEQGIPERFAFKQTSDYTPATILQMKWQQHHLYVCYSGSLALKNHLLFRKALRSDKYLKESYSNLKITLTSDPAITMEQYTKLKTQFIVTALASLGFNEMELQEISDANL
jgi:GrpB-like predicted nucleotidyltransferase (UPF0157 family)